MELEESTVLLLSMDFDSPDFHRTDYQRALDLARFIISQLEEDVTKKDQIEPQALSRLLFLVQRLAFVEPDQDPEPFLAEWCERQWASRIQTNPFDAESQLGLAKSWLLRAQPSLARIEHAESTGRSTQSSSSSNGSAANPRTRRRATADMDRINSQDYVAARDMLRPAVEHVDQALSILYRSGTFQGRMLELAAEVYIHFGNVSHPQNNEICYQRALHCLLLVNRVPDYEMDIHLKEFYETNVDYISEENLPWYSLVEVSL